jgi:hypothetical protein
MKAPLVREGSKENGTQVTGNRIYKGCLVCKLELPGQAPILRTIANTPGSGSRNVAFLDQIRWEGQTL